LELQVHIVICKLHAILQPYKGSTYHMFRQAAVAEELVSEAFGDMADRIYKLRDKMIHVDEEELGRIGGTFIVPHPGSPVKVAGPNQEEIEFETVDYDTIQRPLRKIPESEKLKTVLEGINRYSALIDTYFANMVPEIKVLKVVQYET